ncbi:class I SAM-dependent methyltransferase [Longispora urticae]
MTRDVNYDDGLYVGYDDGQSLPPGTTEQLLAEFTSRAPAHRPLTALDLGAGTGRFSPGLADRFGGTVYAVEPSAQMRALALARRPHPRVLYLDGSAECLPLPANACDVVLLFLVYHHVADRAGAFAEIARVLRPGGRVLLCGNFAGRPSPRAWSPYFPRAHEVEESGLPTVEETEKAALRAGLGLVSLSTLTLEIAPNLTAYLERIRHRAVSAFRHLTEVELANGLNQLAAAAASEPPAPVTSAVDLVVLARRE